MNSATAPLALAAMLLTAFAVGALAKARLGGQTGDILGAVQILSETAILLVFAAVFSDLT